jgi:hypothetical protein
VQISSDGGTEAVWAPSGRDLFYRNRDQMMAVAITMDPTFSAAKPRLRSRADTIWVPCPA